VGAKWKTTPLFNTYFFARIEERWRAIERAMGVASVVKFGAQPARWRGREDGLGPTSTSGRNCGSSCSALTTLAIRPTPISSG
jgi:hypothetical protein